MSPSAASDLTPAHALRSLRPLLLRVARYPGLAREIGIRPAIERAVTMSTMRSPAWLLAAIGRRRARTIDGFSLDAQLAALLGLEDVVRSTDLRKLTPDRARRQIEASVHVVSCPAPLDVSISDRSVPGSAGSIPVRIYTPQGIASPSAALVYLHGGGWVVGSVATHDGFCRELAKKAACRVVSVDYRLAPEHRFPGGLDDALAAFRWVIANAAELGIDPRAVGVGGDSAGGNLSAVVAQRTARDDHPPSLQVLLYPALDATCSYPSHRSLGEAFFLTEGMIEWYLGHYLVSDRQRRDPSVSPLLATDLRGLAPALIYTAGFDPLRDEGRAYADRLREAGVRVRYVCYERMIHGFVMMGGAVSAARTAVDEIAGEVGEELRAALV